MDLITVTEIAKLWGVTARRVQALCENGRIDGAEKLGKMWILPKGTPKPIDGRTKAAKQRKTLET
jgi:hypothetical protein